MVRLVLTSLMILTMTLSAWSATFLDQTNTLYHYHTTFEATAESVSQLMLSKSFDLGQTTSSPEAIYTFDQVITAEPSFAIDNNLILLSWATDDKINVTISDNYGATFSLPQTITITDEVLSQPQVAIDSLHNKHLAFLAYNPDNYSNKIYYTQLASLEPTIIHSDQEQIDSLKLTSFDHGLLVYWQKPAWEGKLETYLISSLDWGKHFSATKTIPWQEKIKQLGWHNSKLVALKTNPKLELVEIKEQPLMPPQIACFDILGPNNHSFQLSTDQTPPYQIKTALSAEDGSLWLWDVLIANITDEAISLDIPFQLTEGNYALKTTIFDGSNLSSDSELIGFSFDQTPPQIKNLETIRIGSNLLISGEVTEIPAELAIGSSIITLESETTFTTQTSLAAGNNLIALTARDLLGNQSTESLEVLFNPAAPELFVLRPSKDDWFKADSYIIIETAVFDLQNDLNEESVAQVSINNQVLDQTLDYDPEDKKLYGIISIPTELADGEHQVTIAITDQAQNLGQTSFTLKIDRQAPTIATSSTNTSNNCFTNQLDSFKLNYYETGVGLDPTGTIIRIGQASLESQISLETNNILRIDLADNLQFGSFEVEIIPRDLVGNLGTRTKFNLFIDQTYPLLTLTSSLEPVINHRSLMVKGNIEETNPKVINIYLNQTKIDSFDCLDNYFAKEITLLPGSNYVIVEAEDQAGNKTQDSFMIVANIASAASVLTSTANAPNPFNPNQESMYFTYTLANQADLKIYVFDLVGNLIWSQVISSATTGNTSWNGIDLFGRTLSKGVYPYIISATTSGQREISRGKILVY